MRRFTHQLPPLTQLAHFESAARHESFKEAAGEHNVTPSAVSHQIRKLEHELDVELFERNGVGVALTVAGQELFDVLNDGFSRMSSVVRDLRSTRSVEVVKIAAPGILAACWLAPLVAEFARRERQIIVEILPIDKGSCDTEMPAVDLRICYGPSTKDAEARVAMLFEDALVPLMSPSSNLLGANPSLDDIATADLIRTETDCLLASDWGAWFRKLGYDKPVMSNGPRVNTIHLALEVAQQGLGIMLGWEKMQEALLVSGRLIRAGSFAVPSRQAFYLERTKTKKLTEPVRAVQKWILSQVK